MGMSDWRAVLDRLEEAKKWTLRENWAKANAALEAATAIALDAYATKPDRTQITGHRVGSGPAFLGIGYVGGCT